MTETAQAPVFAIQRVYLKDLSVEIPHAPRIFLETQQPSVEIQMDVGSEKIADGIFESTVTITITTKVAEKVAFLIEAKQGGIFEIRNVPEEQMPLLINVVCPNIVYPYLRSNVADTVQRTGFPPIHLAEINFEGLYQQRLQQMKAEQAQAAPAAGSGGPGTGNGSGGAAH
ncbi:MAG: protein-export chaperone SecB [Burkholderiaceae bacterium]|jgi:preprotein translocase subunit SecB|nr:protein-export chaperone SecB [Burkholderiaceae bacterium]